MQPKVGHSIIFHDKNSQTFEFCYNKYPTRYSHDNTTSVSRFSRLFLRPGKKCQDLHGITVDADTVVQVDAGGYAELRLEHTKVKIASLLDLWKTGRIGAFSVEIKTSFGTRRGCVHRCDDGTVQHDTCSETDDDMLHCIEALKGRCGR